MKNNEPIKLNTLKDKLIFVLEMVWNLGYMIALPIVLFTFGGAYLDKKFSTSPAFILTAVFLSITVSTIIIIKKFVSYIK